jgi:hypothetical protein
MQFDRWIDRFAKFCIKLGIAPVWIGTNCTLQQRPVVLASSLNRQPLARETPIVSGARDGRRCALRCDDLFIPGVSATTKKNKLVMAATPARALDNSLLQARRSAAALATASRLASTKSSFQPREVERSMTKPARIAFAASLLAPLMVMGEPASALVPQANGSLQHQLRLQDELITEIRARAGGSVRRTTVTGPRGNTASRTVARRGAVVRRPGGWARPAHYRWRPGGAIAAGAAIGFVTAATAAAWAGSPPAPGYCWYYTDASRTQGFWDVCP